VGNFVCKYQQQQQQQQQGKKDRLFSKRGVLCVSMKQMTLPLFHPTSFLE
jgi:hypothetical protein